jgi:hypothetical protein
MSVEFNVKSYGRAVPFAALVQSIRAEWVRRFPSDEPPRWDPPLEPNDSVGDRAFRSTVAAEDSKIALMVHSAGSEAYLGEDGGWWFVVEVALRNPRSFALLVFVTACLGKLLSSTVIDESNLL